MCAQASLAQSRGATVRHPALLCLRNVMVHKEDTITGQLEDKKDRFCAPLWCLCLHSSQVRLILHWDAVSLHGNQHLPLLREPWEPRSLALPLRRYHCEGGDEKCSLLMLTVFPGSIRQALKMGVLKIPESVNFSACARAARYLTNFRKWSSVFKLTMVFLPQFNLLWKVAWLDTYLFLSEQTTFTHYAV